MSDHDRGFGRWAGSPTGRGRDILDGGKPVEILPRSSVNGIETTIEYRSNSARPVGGRQFIMKNPHSNDSIYQMHGIGFLIFPI